MGSANAAANNSSVPARNSLVTVLGSASNHSGLEEATSARHDEMDPRRKSSWKKGLLIIAGFLVSFLIIVICRDRLNGQARGFDVFANLYLAGVTVFGGGPVVKPPLREYIVAPEWVTPRDSLLHLAITQASSTWPCIWERSQSLDPLYPALLERSLSSQLFSARSVAAYRLHGSLADTEEGARHANMSARFPRHCSWTCVYCCVSAVRD